MGERLDQRAVEFMSGGMDGWMDGWMLNSHGNA